MDKKSINYNMSFGYVHDWTSRDAIRELVSNCMDTKTQYSINKVDDSLVIKDSGDGLSLSMFAIGKSESRQSAEAIGQFGEGLKVALMILTREGHDVTITSNNLVINNAIDSLGDEPVFKLEYTDDNPHHQGTEIIISGWHESTYDELFMVNRQDEVLKTIEGQGQILDNCGLFVKGVYIQDLEGYAFGYNALKNVTLNRDRKSASAWDIQNFVGDIWENNYEPADWEVLFKMIYEVNDGFVPKESYMSVRNNDALGETIKTAWYALFGENAVLFTDMAYANEAKHRKAKVIRMDIGGSIRSVMLDAGIMTDAEWTIKQAGDKAFKLPESILTQTQKKNYLIVKKLGVKLGYYEKVVLADLPHSVGDANLQTKVIRMRPEAFDTAEKAMMVFIHELAHILSGAGDLTDEHSNMIATLGAKLASMLLKL